MGSGALLRTALLVDAHRWFDGSQCEEGVTLYRNGQNIGPTILSFEGCYKEFVNNRGDPYIPTESDVAPIVPGINYEYCLEAVGEAVGNADTAVDYRSGLV